MAKGKGEKVVKRSTSVNRKASKKKAAAKKKATKKKQQAKYTIKGKHKRVVDIVKAANKALDGDGKIVTGDQVEDLDLRKRRTGNPAYDYITIGGLITGGASTSWGPDRTAKTTFAAHIAKYYQSQGLAVCVAAIETFDKPWWRRIGAYIPYSSFEMKSLPYKSDREKAKRYNTYYEKLGWIPLTLLMHASGVRVLDMVIGMSKVNVFDLLIVDSLGAVVDISTVEGKSLVDATYAGNSQVMGRFSSYITATFNYRFDEDGNYTPLGDFDNQTTALCLNQARVTINSRSNAGHKKFHPPGGMALRHLWNQAIFHQEGDEVAEYINQDARRVRSVNARIFRMVGSKMRAAPEQRAAEIMLSLKPWDEGPIHHKAGELDVWKSLRALSTTLGVVERRGANLYYGDCMWKGKLDMELDLREDKDMYEDLYGDMIEAARIDSLTGEVPDVPGEPT